jgi:hypothetical protein
MGGGGDGLPARGAGGACKANLLWQATGQCHFLQGFFEETDSVGGEPFSGIITVFEAEALICASEHGKVEGVSGGGWFVMH